MGEAAKRKQSGGYPTGDMNEYTFLVMDWVDRPEGQKLLGTHSLRCNRADASRFGESLVETADEPVCVVRIVNGRADGISLPMTAAMAR